MNSTDTKPKSKAEREAEEKAKRRAEAATIVAGLKQALDGDEQLLGFTRGRLAGGIRGKLSLGPEAFFAPYVNVGLTERRLVIQHINAETGRPGEILPHYYALGDIAAMNCSDIETFGGEAAARLTVRLRNEQHTRLRLRGQSNFENAQAIVEVFRSLTLAQRPGTTPTQRVCATCQHILDQPFKFCPYCGQQQELTATVPTPPPTAATAEPERSYPPTPPGPTEPDFLDTVPYQDASVFRGPTVEDGLEFLTPAPHPTVATEPEPTPAPETSPVAETSAETAQDSAFETPSTFEGWSVDPETASATAEPSVVAEAVVETPAVSAKAVETPASAAEPAFPGGFDIETEASVAETNPEAPVVPEEQVENAVSPTELSPVPETVFPTVPPEAEFAAVPESVLAAVTPVEERETAAVEAPPMESEPAPHPAPVLHLEPVVARQASEHENSSTPEPAAVAPVHDSAGFVTAPEAPTPLSQDFEAFAPVTPTPSVPAFTASPEGAEPRVAAEIPLQTQSIQDTPVSPSTSEDRFAALLKEIRGSDASAQPANPSAVPERKDGPMSVQVHIDRPPIKVNEKLEGRNAEEVVGKLKGRVLPELNFALRLMVNSFSNLRFAQEIVRRYNDREKTNYPIPNSCWEFLQSAETMGYATIHINS